MAEYDTEERDRVKRDIKSRYAEYIADSRDALAMPRVRESFFYRGERGEVRVRIQTECGLKETRPNQGHLWTLQALVPVSDSH